MITRLETADKLKLAGAMHFAKRGYAVNPEVGLLKRGRLRADLFCLSFKNTVIVEVKSCWQDFVSDNKTKKWQKYLPYANQFYFLSTLDVIKKIEKEIQNFASVNNVGLIYLNPKTGHLKVYKKSSKIEVDSEIQINLIYRCAYRGAKYTKRNTRRLKIFLD